VYSQGATVLHMLRVHLGESVLDAAIQQYIKRHVHGLVDSEAFRRTLEDASGQHLGWLFDQWVTGTGTPSFKVSHAHTQSEGDEGMLTVTIKQTTKGTPFHAPVEVEIGTKEGVEYRTVWVDEGTTRLAVPMSEPPQWVVADPRGGVLATWSNKQAAKNWVNQATHSPIAFARLLALHELGEQPQSELTIATLKERLNNTTLHPDFRAVAAAGLGKLASPPAIDALIEALSDSDDHVRRAAAAALGQTPTQDATVKALVHVSSKDAYPSVRTQALHSLARLKPKFTTALAREWLSRPYRAPLEQDFSAAIDVLGNHGTFSDMERILPFTKARWRRDIRRSTAWSLVNLFQRLDEDQLDSASDIASRAIEVWLADPDQRMRETAIAALGRLGDKPAAARLQAFASQTTLTAHANIARDAALSIRNRKKPTKPDDRSPDIERLEERLSELEKRLKDIETWR